MPRGHHAGTRGVKSNQTTPGFQALLDDAKIVSPYALAKKCDLPLMTVLNYARGRSSSPNFATLEKLASGLSCEPIDVLRVLNQERHLKNTTQLITIEKSIPGNQKIQGNYPEQNQG